MGETRRWCCWRCKVLGCDMQIVPGARYVDEVREPYNFGAFGPDRWRVRGEVHACSRCHHYDGSEVCGGRRDGHPPIWRRWPSLRRDERGWMLFFWWRGQPWCAINTSRRAVLRTVWAHRAQWLPLSRPATPDAERGR